MNRKLAALCGILALTTIALGAMLLDTQIHVNDLRAQLVEQDEHRAVEWAILQAHHAKLVDAIDAGYAELRDQVLCLRAELAWAEGYIPTLDVGRIENARRVCALGALD